MGKLSEMINVGKVLEKRLAQVGIFDDETLARIGSKEVYQILLENEGDTCFNTLCALEGAVEGIRCHDLSKDKKEELKLFFDSFNKLKTPGL